VFFLESWNPAAVWLPRSLCINITQIWLCRIGQLDDLLPGLVADLFPGQVANSYTLTTSKKLPKYGIRRCPSRAPRHAPSLCGG
jgi:hypothetical protein